MRMDDTTEALAEQVHLMKSAWVKYMLDNPTTPNILLWRVQAAQAYADLPDTEKIEYRAWAGKLLGAVEQRLESDTLPRLAHAMSSRELRKRRQEAEE